MEHVFLLGMPYSGKSTLGRSIANRLKLRFIDLDKEIEKLGEKTVPEIFSEQGEEYFRSLETKALEQIVSEDVGAVVALGGGTPCFNNNIELIKKKGLSIFLDVTLEELAQRASGDNYRPLLQGRDLYAALQELRDQREDCYRRADLVVRGDEIQADEVITSIKSWSQSSTDI